MILNFKYFFPKEVFLRRFTEKVADIQSCFCQKELWRVNWIYFGHNKDRCCTLLLHWNQNLTDQTNFQKSKTKKRVLAIIFLNRNWHTTCRPKLVRLVVPVAKDFKIPLWKNIIVDKNFFFLDLMRGFDFLKEIHTGWGKWV